MAVPQVFTPERVSQKPATVRWSVVAERPRCTCGDKKVALDHIYDEFCDRREAGEDIDVDAYIAKFSAYQSSLRRLFDLHEFLENNPDVLAN